MGLYSDWIFPRLMDRTLRRPEVNALRTRALRDAVEPVLEIGLGTGLNLACYPESVREVTALDLHEPQLRFVRDRLAGSPVAVHFRRGDAESLPFPDASFRSVVTTWLLCSVADPAAVLAEIRRVLQPDGLYLFIEHGLSPDPEQRRLQQRLTPITRIAACGCTLTRPIRSLVHDAGFDAIDIEELDMPSLGSASGHLFIGAAWRRARVDRVSASRGG